jgi:phosphoglycolate phosphatase
MTHQQFVLFDLDGTLVDSAPDLTGALNHTMAQIGVPLVDEASVRHMVGFGALRLIEQGLEAGGVTLNSDEIAAAFRIFLDHYGDHAADLTKAFPGTDAALQQLKGQGAVMGVCTNKPQMLSDKVLNLLSLDHYFDAVIGADTVVNRKPHADHIHATLDAIGGDPARAIMVGDSATDIDAAKNAGIPSIAVTFGYTTIPAAELGADGLVDHMSELPDAIAALIA